MRLLRSMIVLVIMLGVTLAWAAPQRGRGRSRRTVAVMTLTTTAWPDGGRIPTKYTQAGDDVSPPLTWDGVPEETESFVLLFHDHDVATGDGTDDLLQWLVWNIPGSLRALPESLAQGPELPDGIRQISVTGPFYRGPGAPASGPEHHYSLELFALDTRLDVRPVGETPAQIRRAVFAAMAGHVLGKGVTTGRFRR